LLRRSLWHSAWPLLILANLFWSGNVIVGRFAAGSVPPVALAFWRWTGAFLIALCIAWPRLRHDLPELVRRWRIMLLLAATGIASFNTMSYIGLNHTSALNVLLLQSSLPLIIVVWVYALFGERPTARQAIGVLVSLAGVAVIAGQGSLRTLLALRLNVGDLWVLGAMVVYGAYCALLRRRPAVHPLSFLTAAMGIGACMMLPFMLWERSQGATIVPVLPSYLAIAYTALFPSLVAYLLFNRGVELIGPSLAGQSVHLMPLFGSVLAVLLLHETMHGYHLAGIALIGCGIVVSSIKIRRTEYMMPKKT
jgi:drug/metabolite transporter (DMT)-like permease